MHEAENISEDRLRITFVKGFGEVSLKDIGGNSQKDEAGYVGTYTEVLMKGATILVADPISTILEKVREARNESAKNSPSWVSQPNV